MRIGFVGTLLWERWGPFWWSLAGDAGAEPVRSHPQAVRAALDDPRIAHVRGLAFAVAAAEAIAMPDCDLLVAPDLNPGVQGGTEGGRGGGQDPWIASFPAALATSVSGLPPVFDVPADPYGAVEPLALEFLRAVLRDPTRVRRVWDRHRASPRAPRTPGVRWLLRPSETRTVGLVGQPWLMRDELAALLGRPDEHIVAQHQLDPRELRSEGVRADATLVPTDAEAVGAARLFGRRGVVREIRVLVDAQVGADDWLVRRMQDVVRKDLTVVDVRSLPDPVAALLGESV